MGRPDFSKRLSEAAAAMQAADAALTNLVREARDAGMSWTDIVDATGLTRSAVRWRAGAADDWAYVAKRREARAAAAEQEEVERIESRLALTEAAEPGTNHVGVARAAEMLHLSRPAVYEWARAGRLRMVKTGKRKAVAVDPATGLIELAPRGTFDND